MKSIQYNREENIHQVMDFFGNDNGELLVLNEEENEYHVLNKSLGLDVKLKKGDWIGKISDKWYVVWEEKAYEKYGHSNSL